jgi:preprotein translocase SecE subunit
MASLTNNQEKPMTSEAAANQEPEEERQPQRAEKPTPQGGGFFTIYKHGQGYWTRLLTALAAAAILLASTNFLWQNIPPYLNSALSPVNPTGAESVAIATRVTHITMIVCASFLVLGALLLWKITNAPTNVDFLIATDSEMKKVNWTSRKELIGSTKIVVFFMFVIAIVLFLVDVFFGYLFYFLHVLKSPPF